jgi:bifunctional non-homologous end joining protein LigD
VIGFIPPQLLAPARQLPTGANWRYELKYDGYRAQVHVSAHGVRLFTRSGLDWTCRFPRLTQELAASVRAPCILDGEIYATDPAGRPDFTLLCNRLGGSGDVQFVAFDVLATDGVSTLHLPLSARRYVLRSMVSESAQVHLVEQATDPAPLLALANERGWEGLVAKANDGTYQPGSRSPNWRKLKLKCRQEFIVAGWRPDLVTGALKSLALATIEDERLTFRGSVGTGFTLDERQTLPQRFVPVASLFVRRLDPTIIPLQPNLVAEIEYLELSTHGIVRQPTFLGVRFDKAADDVRLEI